MYKKIISLFVFSFCFLAYLTAEAEIETTLAASPALVAEKIAIKSTSSDFEVNDNIFSIYGFRFDMSAYIGKKDFPICAYASFGMIFSFNQSYGDISIRNVARDIEKVTSTTFEGDSMIGPGFKFNAFENFNINFAPCFHIYWRKSIQESDSKTYTDSIFLLGGGIDSQFRFNLSSGHFSIVCGMKFTFDGIINYYSDSLKETMGMMGISYCNISGFLFTWQPYFGIGYRF